MNFFHLTFPCANIFFVLRPPNKFSNGPSLYVLRTFLLFFFWRLQKEMGTQKLFVQDTMKVIHNTRTTASIIKHSIIHINMYLEKGMNVVFYHHPNAFFLFPPVFVHSFCVLLVLLFRYSQSW